MPKGMMGFQKGDLNPSRNPERKKQISEQRKNSITPERTKKRISRSMKKALKNPELRKKWSECKKGKKPTEETKRKIAIAKAKRPKKMSTLFKNADAFYSRYIRLKYSKNGYVKCVTCGRFFPIKEMDCGHFVGRGYMSTRYFEKNTHPQCRYCNRFKEGVKDVYALWLVEHYGQGILKELNYLRNQHKRFRPWELQEIADNYKLKIKEIERKT